MFTRRPPTAFPRGRRVSPGFLLLFTACWAVVLWQPSKVAALLVGAGVLVLCELGLRRRGR